MSIAPGRLRIGCVIALLLQSPAMAAESRMDVLRSELKPGDDLEMNLRSGGSLVGEYGRLLVPENAVRLRIWDTEHDRFRDENVPLDGVERCVRLRTEGTAAFPIGAGLLLGAVGAGLGIAFDDALGDDSSGALEIVAPFALVGALAGVIVGAVVMPTRTSTRTLWGGDSALR